MHAKTDSEVTSLAPSSPTRSPRRPVYYVQSPSRDSHDGEKTTTTSFHSTPILSPTGSPPHSHSSIGRHSRESSSSRFSGSLKPGSRKVSPNDGSSKSASRPQKPKITMKSIKFEQFKIQAGSDFTGVSTDMITMNSTVKMIYRNTGTFFGVHVTSSPLDLSYSQINIASGTLQSQKTNIPSKTILNMLKDQLTPIRQYFTKAFPKSQKFIIDLIDTIYITHCRCNYQRWYLTIKKSQRSVSITVTGNKVPLYGSGASLSSSTGTTSAPISLKLNFIVRSRAYVLGKLVKPKFYKKIQCDLTFDPKKLNLPISLKKSCTYD
ncbi:hypothetical protein GOBAR_DD17227 [Gossypium barbadense]|nr:hypothetical protein GOBAR_DD17227 [Gossypium barbadense]